MLLLFYKHFHKGWKRKHASTMIFLWLVLLGTWILCISFACVITSKPMRWPPQSITPHYYFRGPREPTNQHNTQLDRRADATEWVEDEGKSLLCRELLDSSSILQASKLLCAINYIIYLLHNSVLAMYVSSVLVRQDLLLYRRSMNPTHLTRWTLCKYTMQVHLWDTTRE